MTRSVAVIWEDDSENKVWYYRAGDCGSYDLDFYLPPDDSVAFNADEYKRVEKRFNEALLSKTDPHTVKHITSCEKKFGDPMLPQMIAGTSLAVVVRG